LADANDPGSAIPRGESPSMVEFSTIRLRDVERSRCGCARDGQPDQAVRFAANCPERPCSTISSGPVRAPRASGAVCPAEPVRSTPTPDRQDLKRASARGGPLRLVCHCNPLQNTFQGFWCGASVKRWVSYTPRRKFELPWALRSGNKGFPLHGHLIGFAIVALK